MKEDRKFNIRFSSGLTNPWDFDLRGAGHLYVQPGKEYFLENCPKSLLDVVISYVGAMNVTYQLTDNKKGCFQTINCINYDINDPRSLLGRLRTNRIEESEPEVVTEPEVVEEVTEPEVTEESVVEEVTEPEVVEEATEPEVVEEATEEVVEEVPEDIVEDATPEVSKEEIEGMSKPQLEELAESLGIESGQTKTKKKLKAEIIEKLGL